MFKMLIADDEPKIRWDIRNAADWKGLGIGPICEAEDGEIALRKAAGFQPDIVLVDICMPFVNGLDFIRRVKRILPESIVIIITVYDDFPYAQQAVKLQVFDYLLKPIDRGQLLESIRKAKEALAHRHAFRSLIRSSDTELKKKFLLSLIGGRLTKQEAQEQARLFRIPFAAPCGLMVVRVLEKIVLEDTPDAWDRELLLYAVQNMASDLISGFQPSGVFTDEKGNVVAVAPAGSAAQWSEASEKIVDAAGACLKRAAVSSARVLPGGLWQVAQAYPELLEETERKSCGAPIAVLIRSYLERHFSEPGLSLQTAAEKIRISPSYLSKILKRETGLSFIDFLTRLRIRKAIQLMGNPREKIYEVAEKVGYSDQHYFSTAFKKVKGVSPAEYRRARGSGG